MSESPSPAFEIRRVSPDEWRLWRDARLEALRDSPAAFGSRLDDWIDAPEQRWRDRLSLPGAHDVVAVDRTQVLGMMSVVPSGAPSTVTLISAWVAPRARGRRVAAALIDEVVGAARAAGASVVDLSVMPDNFTARRTYERAGFRVLDEAGAPLPDGRHQVLMRRSLADREA